MGQNADGHITLQRFCGSGSNATAKGRAHTTPLSLLPLALTLSHTTPHPILRKSLSRSISNVCALSALNSGPPTAPARLNVFVHIQNANKGPPCSYRGRSSSFLPQNTAVLSLSRTHPASPATRLLPAAHHATNSCISNNLPPQEAAAAGRTQHRRTATTAPTSRSSSRPTAATTLMAATGASLRAGTSRWVWDCVVGCRLFVVFMAVCSWWGRGCWQGRTSCIDLS